jgi:periplasmic protein TonB
VEHAARWHSLSVGGRLPLLASLLLHAALGVAVWRLSATAASRPALVPLAVETVPPPVAPPPPPAPAPQPVEEHAPSAAPKIVRAPKLRKAAAAQGPRPETLPAVAEAAPLPPVEAATDVQLPAAEGFGAGGVDALGSGEPGGGSGDGAGNGDGGSPPIPLEAARRTRLPYTREAIEAHVGGVLLVNLLVAEDGSVAEATLARPLGYGLDPIAIVTARRFRFIPAKDASGRPVAQWIVWRFHFEPAN